MASHSSVLAWRIPGTAEPGGLPSMGSHRVGHDWSDLAAAATHSFAMLYDYGQVSRNLHFCKLKWDDIYEIKWYKALKEQKAKYRKEKSLLNQSLPSYLLEVL